MIAFKIARNEILKPLEYVSGAIQSNAKDPVDSNVLIRVLPNDPNGEIKDAQYKLQLTCTEGKELQMSSEIPLLCSEQDIQTGNITVKAKLFLEFVKNLADGDILSFEYKDLERNAKISTKTSAYNLATISADYFKVIGVDEPEFKLKIKLNELQNIISTTDFAIAADNFRFFLKGMKFAISKTNPREVNIFTSDAHRISIQKGILEEDCVVPESYGFDGFIVPKKSISEISKLLASIKEKKDEIIEFNVGQSYLSTEINGIKISSLLLAANYPDVLNFVPSNCDMILVVNREKLNLALKRVSFLCSDNRMPAVVFDVKGNSLTLRAKNAQKEEAFECIDLDIHEGADFEMAFNVLFYRQVCDVITTEKIKISLKGASNSSLIEPLPNEKEQATYARYVINRCQL